MWSVERPRDRGDRWRRGPAGSDAGTTDADRADDDASADQDAGFVDAGEDARIVTDAGVDPDASDACVPQDLLIGGTDVVAQGWSVRQSARRH